MMKIAMRQRWGTAVRAGHGQLADGACWGAGSRFRQWPASRWWPAPGWPFRCRRPLRRTGLRSSGTSTSITTRQAGTRSRYRWQQLHRLPARRYRPTMAGPGIYRRAAGWRSAGRCGRVRRARRQADRTGQFPGFPARRRHSRGHRRQLGRGSTTAGPGQHAQVRLGLVPGGDGQVMLVRVGHRLGPVAGSDLGEQMVDVRLDGAIADYQPCRDLSVRQAGRDQR